MREIHALHTTHTYTHRFVLALRKSCLCLHNEEEQRDNSYAKKKYFSELFFTGTLLVVIGVPRKQGVRVPKSAERAQRVFGNSSIAR